MASSVPGTLLMLSFLCDLWPSLIATSEPLTFSNLGMVILSEKSRFCGMRCTLAVTAVRFFFAVVTFT